MRGRCPARIYACNRPRFANLPKIPNPDTKLLEKNFSHFTKNFRIPNLYAKLLEMLLGVKQGRPSQVGGPIQIKFESISGYRTSL
jgi:hypothetical protein